MVLSAAILLASIVFTGCARTSHVDYLPRIGPAAPPGSVHVEYSFGVLPLHNAVRLFAMYQPLMDEINRHVTGFTVKLETARTYAQYEIKARNRQLDFLMMNSHLVIPTEEIGYEIIGRTADKIRGVIVIRRDAPIRRIRELKGQSISFGSRTDLAGAMLQKLLLKQSGLDVDRVASPKYVNSQDSALENVCDRRSAAACVSESAWQSFRMNRPELADLLEVRWQTEPLVGLGVLARRDIPREHVLEVAHALFKLEESQPGRKILAQMHISGFRAADEASYDPVWEFLNDYRRSFGYTPTLGGAE